MACCRTLEGLAGNRSSVPYRCRGRDVKKSNFSPRSSAHLLLAMTRHRQGCARYLDGCRDSCPTSHEFEGLNWLSKKNAESENPDINIATATNEPDDPIKIAYFVNRPAAKAKHTPFRQSSNRFRADQQREISESARQAFRSFGSNKRAQSTRSFRTARRTNARVFLRLKSRFSPEPACRRGRRGRRRRARGSFPEARCPVAKRKVAPQATMLVTTVS